MCVCVCVFARYQTPFSSLHKSGPGLFLLTGKHPVVGQLPWVSFSALPGESRDRPNLPPYPSAFTALFLDRSFFVVHLTCHEQIMTVEILRTIAIAAPAACRTPVDLLAVATAAASNCVRFAGSVSCFTSIAIDRARHGHLMRQFKAAKTRASGARADRRDRPRAMPQIMRLVDVHPVDIVRCPSPTAGFGGDLLARAKKNC